MTQAEIIAAAVAAAVAATAETATTDAPAIEVRETSTEALSTSAKSGC